MDGVRRWLEDGASVSRFCPRFVRKPLSTPDNSQQSAGEIATIVIRVNWGGLVALPGWIALLTGWSLISPESPPSVDLTEAASFAARNHRSIDLRNRSGAVR